MPATIPCDVAIVGGGLAGGLLALALARRRPDLRVRLVDGARRIGGNHIWSFFGSDVAPADRWLVAPLVSYGWTQYQVAFPSHQRVVRQPYYSIESERLDQLVRTNLREDALLLGRQVVDVAPTGVVLADGDRIEAGGVIDCRGAGDLSHFQLGWQKFVGRELRLSEPHMLACPTIMDARVPQRDGYRFVYVLPFAATRLFVEDTYYSDTPDVDAPALLGHVDAYAAEQGWQVERSGREEGGVLPVVMGGDFEAYWKAGGAGVAKAGMRGGMFHPVTGYSLPDAVRTAALVATAPDLGGTALHDLLFSHARRAWKARGFYRTLSTLLFKAADPDQRYRVLERFYRLDARLIARFYAGNSTLLDRVRVLSGKPPVPIGRAVQAIREARK